MNQKKLILKIVPVIIFDDIIRFWDRDINFTNTL